MGQHDYKFRTGNKGQFIADMARLRLPKDVIGMNDIATGYYQSEQFCLIWLGELEGSVGNYVDIRSTIPLPEFETVFMNTVIDNSYPHEFS